MVKTSWYMKRHKLFAIVEINQAKRFILQIFQEKALYVIKHLEMQSNFS